MYKVRHRIEGVVRTQEKIHRDLNLGSLSASSVTLSL